MPQQEQKMKKFKDVSELLKSGVTPEQLIQWSCRLKNEAKRKTAKRLEYSKRILFNKPPNVRDRVETEEERWNRLQQWKHTKKMQEEQQRANRKPIFKV